MSVQHENGILDWADAGFFFNQFGFRLRKRFGGRVQRVSLDGGFTCPNVDGAAATGGCNFCDNRSFSPSRRTLRVSIAQQLHDGIAKVRRRYGKVTGFIAYFQPATGTYAPPEHLQLLYREALSHPDVIGLAIGTRPDCLSDACLEMLNDLGRQHYLSVELGMQSMHDRSLRWMNRGHCHSSMIDAVARCQDRTFELCAHLILGVPGESFDDMIQTADEVAWLAVDAVKLHNLYAVNGTPLGAEVSRGDVQLMSREAYVETVVSFLERLPPQMIVERVSGDAPPDYLIGPQWCLQKAELRVLVDQEFARRGTRQGSRYEPPRHRQPPQRIAGLPMLGADARVGRLPVASLRQ